MSMVGKTLGNFECTSLIGKGGMGEVYRAKDQKLDRDVAIKVLPEEFAKDADRIARFQFRQRVGIPLSGLHLARSYSVSSQVHIVLNWFEELKEKVPTD